MRAAKVLNWRLVKADLLALHRHLFQMLSIEVSDGQAILERDALFQMPETMPRHPWQAFCANFESYQALSTQRHLLAIEGKRLKKKLGTHPGFAEKAQEIAVALEFLASDRSRAGIQIEQQFELFLLNGDDPCFKNILEGFKAAYRQFISIEESARYILESTFQFPEDKVKKYVMQANHFLKRFRAFQTQVAEFETVQSLP